MQLHGRILTPEGWIEGRLNFDGRICTIEANPLPPGPAHTILPGFIDLHVHGAANVDIMAGGDAGATVAARMRATARPRCWARR